MDIEQRKLLADHHVQESKTYQYTVENGRLTGDSGLVFIMQYNKNGCAIQGIGLDNSDSLAPQWTREYIDTLLHKHTVFSNDRSKHLVDEYTYDALGRPIQLQILFLDSGIPRTTTLTMVYDQPKHRRKDIYWSSTSSRNKTLSSRSDYNEQGQLVKFHTYPSKAGKAYTQVNMYDQQARPTQQYTVHKGKKKLQLENTYNASGQRITQSRFERNNYTMHQEGAVYTIRKGDHHLIRYAYDAKGLLRRKTGYRNDELIYQTVYAYH